jgi:uncharacterized cupredoxin-like copper-binding protein
VGLRRIGRLLPLAAAAACLSACGAAHLPPATGGRVVDVSERDFSINVSAQHVSPGVVTFRVTNHGPDEHELIVIREQHQLPLRTDGITVNEERLTPETVGVLEPGAPGAVRDLTVRLKKGRYILLCNMSGHFMGGMRADVVVR